MDAEVAGPRRRRQDRADPFQDRRRRLEQKVLQRPGVGQRRGASQPTRRRPGPVVLPGGADHGRRPACVAAIDVEEHLLVPRVADDPLLFWSSTRVLDVAAAALREQLFLHRGRHRKVDEVRLQEVRDPRRVAHLVQDVIAPPTYIVRRGQTIARARPDAMAKASVDVIVAMRDPMAVYACECDDVLPRCALGPFHLLDAAVVLQKSRPAARLALFDERVAVLRPPGGRFHGVPFGGRLRLALPSLRLGDLRAPVIDGEAVPVEAPRFCESLIAAFQNVRRQRVPRRHEARGQAVEERVVMGEECTIGTAPNTNASQWRWQSIWEPGGEMTYLAFRSSPT